MTLPHRADAQTGIFTFAQSSYTADAAQSNASISVILSGTPFTLVSVDFATQDGTATAGVDYVSTTGTLFFADGTFSNAFNVPLINIGVATQSTKTVNLFLFNPDTANGYRPSVRSPYSRSPTPSSPTAVQFSQSAYTVNQGDSNAFITVVRTGRTDTTATVFFNTSDGSAKTGIDYIAISGTLTFTNGITTNTVTIPILPGNPLSTNQTVNLTLSNPNGMSLGSPEQRRAHDHRDRPARSSSSARPRTISNSNSAWPR